MRTLKSVILFAAACMLALPACGDDEDPKDDPKVEICDNNKDDDGDGKVDCADTDCAAHAACKAKECQATETKCGSTCCTAGQSCDNGVCKDPQQCQSGQSPCGTNCCNAGQTCDNGTCKDPQQCQAGETECGDDCCTAGQVCNSGVCEPEQQGCQDGETACGEDCCVAGETCQDNVCLGEVVGDCTVPSSFGAVTASGPVSVGDGGSYMSLQGVLPAADGSFDLISLELYPGMGAMTNGIVPGTYPIAGEDLNYGTCGLCVRLMGDIDETTYSVSAHYFITGGTLLIDQVEGALVATLTDATFEEVTINSQTYETTPVPDGCTTSMDSVAFNGSVPVSCDPLAPTCDAGQGCYFDGQGYSCAPEGTIPAGQACTNVGQCVPGAECFNDGLCHQWCDPAATSTCAANEACTDIGDGMGICLPPPCDPLAQDCDTGEGCYYDGNDFSCMPAGSTQAGGTCGQAYGECVPGAECMNPGVCRAWCDPAATSTCAASEACTDIGDGLGICTPPPEDCDTVGDEDGNGLSDCDDPACAGEPACLAAVCQGAVPLTGLTTTGDTTTGTQAFPRGSCRTAAGKELLYTVSVGNAGETGQLRITVDSDFDAVVYAQSTCGDSTTELACTDAKVSEPEVLVIDNYQGATPFTLIVDGFSSGEGTFSISIEYLIPVCGNGTIEPGETCEDDNATPTSGDGCSDTCQLEQGFACPTAGQACRPIVCGDTFQDEGEQCDDGNTDNGDGCSDTCQFELTEVEPNDDTASATAYSDPYTAQITAGDVDYVSIVLTDASSLIVEVQDLGDGACAAGDLDSRLELFDSTGTSIASNDDIDLWGGNWCSLIDLPSVPAGTYYVKVDSYSATAAFLYKLAITIGVPEACGFDADLGAVTPLESLAVSDGNWVVGEYVLNNDPDKLQIELYPGDGIFASGLTTGTFTLAGDDLQYRTCALCVRLRDRRGVYYMATGGEVTLSSVSGNLTGSLSNVTFEQVTIAEDYTSTPVVDGCQSALTSMAFDDAIEAY